MLQLFSPVTGSKSIVDRTDWIKTAAIILVAIDHTGLYFIEDDEWWRLAGRLAAPIFFYLVGFAQTRKVPAHWIVLGLLLTLLDFWNEGWNWVAPNILLSFALVRFARPAIKRLVESGWSGLVAIIALLVLALPLASTVVEYGAEGWLWALFGLCQRVWLDQASLDQARQNLPRAQAGGPDLPHRFAGHMRTATAVVAAIIYVWQEQKDLAFDITQTLALACGVTVMSVALWRFRQGPSQIQLPAPAAATLSFVGRNTLEIYVLQLVASEIIAKILSG